MVNYCTHVAKDEATKKECNKNRYKIVLSISLDKLIGQMEEKCLGKSNKVLWYLHPFRAYFLCFMSIFFYTF